MLDAYLNALRQTKERGDAREESYYPAFKTLLEAVVATEGQPEAHVTVLPKRTEAGNPDVREWFSLRDSKAWKMSEKRKLIQQDENWKDKFAEILYRPFDTRPIFYHYHAIDRGRENVMKHMTAGENLGLITNRQFKEQPVAFITDALIAHKSVTIYDGNYLFPLYRYLQAEKRDLFSQQREDGARVANLDEGVWDALAAAYGERPAPEDVLHYVYAVLYAPAYRSTYAEFLKTDFPKIPFTADYDLFEQLAALGKQLSDLHLMEHDALDAPTAQFHGEGSGRVARPKRVGRDYRPGEERVYVNEDEQYFGPIPPAVWSYQIGGYQVLDKWLYDRCEKELTLEEIRHYCRVATALGETIRLQEEIDAVYPGVEEDLLATDAPAGPEA